MNIRKQLSLEFKIGLFIVLGTIALIAFIFSQGKFSRVKGIEIKVSFSYVGGVENGSPVRVSGVRVGEVGNIEIMHDVTPRVVLGLKLKPGIRIGRHSRITIRTLGIIGEKYIEITPSTEKEYLANGDMVEGVDPLPLERYLTMGEDIIRNLNGLLVDVRKVIGSKDVQGSINSILVNTNTAALKAGEFLDKAGRLSMSLEETNREVKKVFLANKPKIEAALTNIEKITGDSREIVAEVKDNMGTFAAAGEEIRLTAVDARRLINALENKGVIAQLLKDEDLVGKIKQEVVMLQDTTKEVQQTARKVTDIATNVDTMIIQINSGRGTVGKLLTSDEIYNEVLGFIKDIRLHPWRLFRSK